MKDDGYEIAIHGLLRKRLELMRTLEIRRDELAATQNDILAIERALAAFGYNEELDQSRRRVLKDIRRELRRYIIDDLRKAGPMTTRELADRLATSEGKDISDRKLMKDITARVSKAMTSLVDNKTVTRAKTENFRCQYKLSEDGEVQRPNRQKHGQDA